NPFLPSGLEDRVRAVIWPVALIPTPTLLRRNSLFLPSAQNHHGHADGSNQECRGLWFGDRVGEIDLAIVTAEDRIAEDHCKFAARSGGITKSRDIDGKKIGVKSGNRINKIGNQPFIVGEHVEVSSIAWLICKVQAGHVDCEG